MIAVGLALLLANAAGLEPPLVLAVGVNDPGVAGLAPLRYADDDAVAALDLFGAGPDSGRAFLLSVLDEDSQRAHPGHAAAARAPSRRALREVVAQLAHRIDAERRQGGAPPVVVWLSGHAEPSASGRTRFLLADGDALDDEDLRQEILAPLAAAHRIHVFIDSCFAGGLVRARARLAAVDAAEAAQAFARLDESPQDNVGVWLSSSSATRSWEWQEVGAGVFSAMVRAGLRGAADVDGDDVVRTSELEGWLAAAAASVRIDMARPRVRVIPPPIERDAVVAARAWVADARVLRKDLSGYGLFHVVDAAGRWWLGGSFEPGVHAGLWLPSGARLWLVTRDGERPLEENDSGWAVGERAPSGAQPRSTFSAAVVDEAFREGLFATLWGPSFLRGYRAASREASRPPPPPATSPPAKRWAPAAVTLTTAAVLAAGGGVVAGIFSGISFVQWADTGKERAAHEAFTQGSVLAVVAAVALGSGVGLAMLGLGDGVDANAEPATPRSSVRQP